MNSTVDLSFRYFQSDYTRALRAHYRSRLRLPLDLLMILVLAIAGIYLWRSTNESWVGQAFVTIAAVFSLILVSVFTIIPPLAFRREEKFRDEYSLSFSSQGIHFKTANLDSQLKWSMYSRALIDANSYILYHGARSFTVVPRRVFRSPEQQHAFEKLLTLNIPNIKKKTIQ